MPLVTSRTSLSQGAVNVVSGVVFATGTGADIEINDGAAVGTLPSLAAGEFFEIRDHSLTNNNGLYQVVTVTDINDVYQCDKVFGAAPTTAAAEAVTFLGSTGAANEKSVFFDAQGKGTAILEQGNVDSAGVTGQAIYSFTMQEWKDDDYLIANAPFPMLTIDSDAGKYIIGQDISGNNTGWNWFDQNTFSIRTRKLLRNAGWDEVDANGITKARYVGVVTLGTFEDPASDTAYYQFGNDTTVNDTVDFDFPGPVNEAVSFYEEQVQPGNLAITTTTITRTGGSFINEGYKVGGQVTIRNAETPANDGTYLLTGVTATVLTTTGLTADASDLSAILAVNNDNRITLRLRVRDGDVNGKTFSQANLASAGKAVLGNFVYAFPLANGTDLKISVTDLGIDSNSDGSANVAPYSGMSITYFATPQQRTDLFGGNYNFGIIVNGNDGTAEQVFEFIQWSLRATGGNGTGDIDADADFAYGRAMDELARFVGDTGEFGTGDGINFPTNPDGGGSGVYVDNLNAASKNSVVFYDNTNAPRTFPTTVPVTLDFNQIAIDDATTEYDLFYDRTIRTNVTDFVITTVAGGTFTSAGTNLPNNAEVVVGSFIRVSGLTGGDAAMNGVYQIVTETTPGASWVVTRYDGAAIVAVTSTTANLDQNCIDTPDAILVHTDKRTAEAAAAARPGSAVLTFTAPDTITDTGNSLGIFASGMKIQIEGSTSNDGIYTVDTAAAGTLTLIEQTLVTEAVGVDTDVVITQVVSGLASSDFSFSYEYSDNIQGGRSPGDTFVKAKAVGSTGAQYVQSSVATIQSGVPLTIPVAPATERNYA